MDKHGYGWRVDKKDGRDHLYTLRTSGIPLQSVQLWDNHIMPDIFDQGNLGSCTANAISYCMGFDILNKHVQKVDPTAVLPLSRLFIYYNERVIEGTVKDDAGAEIRDGIKTIAKDGACNEKLKPYKIGSFRRKPSARAYKDALKFAAVEYERIDSTNSRQMIDCLLSGSPFVVGFAVYESFESDTVANTGVVPMPDLNNERLMGGHAVACVGYDKVTERFTCSNSWGQWGNKGYFTIPAAYLNNSNLASDFWSCKTVL